MHAKTISVIIPMYNSEAFIRQSIQSVIDQTYGNFEIIVVDDGSTDRGAEICEEMSAEDSRIYLYRKERKGVSAARNYGLDAAKGEYVFFLDSDDMIHPLLFEEMFFQMEKHHVGVAFCFYENVESDQIETIFGAISCNDNRPKWQIEGEREAEERFHTNDAGVMTRIGGKMLRMDLVGDLRFNETLINGEDTLFIYSLLCKQVRTVFSFKKWYYYRMHTENVSRSLATVRGERYFEYVKAIRDGEYQKKRLDYALNWEMRIANKMEKNYLALKRAGDKEGCKRVKQLAETERRHPLYGYLPFYDKLLFFSCFHCRFFFHVERRLRHIYHILIDRILRSRKT